MILFGPEHVGWAREPHRLGPKLGVWAWSFVGVVIAITVVVFVLEAVRVIVLPLTFAAVIAVCFKPMARSLQRHGFKRAAVGMMSRT